MKCLLRNNTPFPFDAVIVAGGCSRRLGFDKLSALLNGKTVLARSFESLRSVPGCEAVVVVCRQERRAEFAALLRQSSDSLVFADAGEERRDSVASGLESLIKRLARGVERLVAIHDAARPLACVEDISAVVTTAAHFGAAACATPLVDTLMRADANGNALVPVPRENIWAMQTPQVFRLGEISAAIAQAHSAGLALTDDVSAMLAAGHSVRLVPSSRWNPKITFESDLELAEALIVKQHACKEDREGGE